MAFGGFFGGGSDKNNNSSSSTTSTNPSEHGANPIFSNPTTSSSNFSPLSQSAGTSSAEIKNRLQTAIAQQSVMANGRALISKINENCFDHCITAPGTSLSSSENNCLSKCMEKYIEGWNVVSQTYVRRLQREGVQAGAGGATAGQGGLF